MNQTMRSRIAAEAAQPTTRGRRLRVPSAAIIPSSGAPDAPKSPAQVTMSGIGSLHSALADGSDASLPWQPKPTKTTSTDEAANATAAAATPTTTVSPLRTVC